MKMLSLICHQGARCLGQTPQNFNRKLQRGTVSTEELMEIGNINFTMDSSLA